MAKKIELTPSQIIPLLEDTIRNNKSLADKGMDTTSVSIEGQPGIAKTALIKEVANKFPEFHYVKLNTSQIEPCDLIGMPIVSFEMEHNGEKKWIPEKIISHFAALGFLPTGETRTDYALPEWLVKANGKPILLNLDDSNRCSQMMANSVMELVHTQKLASWSLPKGSTVFLTNNPSDGDFLNMTEDKAMLTRRLNLYCKASVDDWAVWAVENGLDQRGIDFKKIKINPVSENFRILYI